MNGQAPYQQPQQQFNGYGQGIDQHQYPGGAQNQYYDQQ